MTKWQQTLSKTFPKAIDFKDLTTVTKDVLSSVGLTTNNTLFGNCTCRDEINQYDIEKLAAIWGENFDLAGLGGYPSAGITGFSAYNHHVPDRGYQFILYGPHIGLDEEGILGKVHRIDMEHETSACGSLIGFLEKIKVDSSYQPSYNPLDPEQYLVEKALILHQEEIISSNDPILTLTQKMYEIIDQRIEEILNTLDSDLAHVLLGGIMINTPHKYTDWFDVKRADFIVGPAKSPKITDLLSKIV